MATNGTHSQCGRGVCYSMTCLSVSGVMKQAGVGVSVAYDGLEEKGLQWHSLSRLCCFSLKAASPMNYNNTVKP